MVDFNNENTISTPAGDVEKITVLERRFNLIEAWESYKKGKFRSNYSSSVDLSVVSARLTSLFIQLEPTLRRRLIIKPKEDSTDYDELRKVCLYGKDEEKILDAILLINKLLDETRLTRFDDRRVYDGSRVEEENEEKGY